VLQLSLALILTTLTLSLVTPHNVSSSSLLLLLSAVSHDASA